MKYYEKAVEIFNPEEAYPIRAYFEAVKGNQDGYFKITTGITLGMKAMEL